ncbi:response regulator [Rhodoplanes serenus]|jgi:CheY-like chemotaxis protein|uniref:Response regulator n=1 Tax=Rhodoplanes serenus TaxID=200615 RepID=A0A9X4XKI4_9BRAD|nr:response regulator [Rhodoplanes serenus]MTW15831.1 response regulator [Rhodoplanes serenus]
MLDRTDDRGGHVDMEAGSPAAPGPAPTLLVIDDDTVHRMILCKVGARAGYEAVGAASYEEAVRLLDGRSYAVITLDLTLGEHGGAEVLHAIAAMDLKTPIIIVSGSNETIRRETAAMANLLSLNVVQTLPKPVDLAHLRRLLAELQQRKAIGLAPLGWHVA